MIQSNNESEMVKSPRWINCIDFKWMPCNVSVIAVGSKYVFCFRDTAT